jgi:hypothetical protein
MKRILSILFSAAVLFLLSSGHLSGQSGAQKLEGTWKMEAEEAGLHFQFEATDKSAKGGLSHNNFSVTVSKSDLTGFKSGDNVSFSIKKPGGEVAMTGDVKGEEGEGKFVYTPDAGYVKSFADAGYKDLSLNILLLFTLKNADINYVSNIRKLGYPELSEDNLVALVALDVSVDYIKQIHDAGFKEIAISKLIGFKALNVDPVYIANMKKLSGGDLSADDITAFAALKIDEKYAEEMYKSGYKLSGNSLIQFKALGITPEYVKEIMSAGLKDISEDEIVQLKSQKIDGHYLIEVKEMGFGIEIDVPLIVKLKIFKIDKAYIEEMKAAGYPGLSTDQLVDFKIFHIDKTFIEKATKFLGSKPSPEQLIQLKVAEGNGSEHSH